MSFIPRVLSKAAAPLSLAVGVTAFTMAQQKKQEPAHCFFGLFESATDKAKKDIIKIIDDEAERRDDGTSIAPTFIRLAWHQSGTFSAKDGTGGSNGSHMRMSPESDWGCNAGLGPARDALNALAKKHGMSHADIWTLAGATAVEAMGGPVVPWRKGRTDSEKPTTVPDGRLPNADNGSRKADVQHIRDILGRMGFNDREMVALCGAHAVGRCHTNASGYWGPWTFAEATFSNEYFRLLVEEKWTVKKTHEGKKWTGPMQFEDPTGKIMMLPADMSLLEDPEFRKWVEAYAKDEQLFFKDFSSAFSKMMELGVKFD
jgi:cytochrome c peroxidase